MAEFQRGDIVTVRAPTPAFGLHLGVQARVLKIIRCGDACGYAVELLESSAVLVVADGYVSAFAPQRGDLDIPVPWRVCGWQPPGSAHA